MQIHFSYHHVVRNEQLDKSIQLNIRKLEKLLTHFSPDLVHLNGSLEMNAAGKKPSCSLTLSLPTTRLHAKEEGGNVLTDLQACFHQIIEQVKKHKQALRHEGEWHRGTLKTAGLETPEQPASKTRKPTAGRAK